MFSKTMARAYRGDEICTERARTLVQQLVERMLPIGLLATPYDRCCVHGHPAAVMARGFAVALHVQLLEVVRQQPQSTVVRQ